MLPIKLNINEELLQFGTVKTFPVDYALLEESGAIRSIPIVLKGSLKVMRTEEDGREILLYYILPGESCIMSFLAGLNDDTSKVKAIVDEEAEVLLIPIDKASELVRSNPQWVDFIFKLYHKRFEELLNVVNALAFKKLDTRILDALHKKSGYGKITRTALNAPTTSRRTRYFQRSDFTYFKTNGKREIGFIEQK